MCDPATATLVIAGTSAVLGTASSIMQGQAQAEAASYNAQVARINAEAAARDRDARAQILEKQAQQREYKAEYEASLLRRKLAAIQGAARARAAASGVQIDSGSPLAVAEDIAKEGAMDIEMTLYNGAFDAWNLRNERFFAEQSGNVRVASYQNEAGLLEAQSHYDPTMDLLAGGVTFGSAATSFWGEKSSTTKAPRFAAYDGPRWVKGTVGR